jgi:four helix bundle protein
MQKEFVLSKQILRSGTSIGANISESVFAQSRMDFVSKMSISLKEASETKYWLDLLYETKYISQEQYDSMSDDLGRITGTLVKIVNTTKQNNV